MSEYIVEFGYEPNVGNSSDMPIGERIVRCRDCYFADEIEGGYWCDRFDCGKEHVKSNGFCAWGKRKKVVDAE